jgi:hypothetical protein
MNNMSRLERAEIWQRVAIRVIRYRLIRAALTAVAVSTAPTRAEYFEQYQINDADRRFELFKKLREHGFDCVKLTGAWSEGRDSPDDLFRVRCTGAMEAVDHYFLISVNVMAKGITIRADN